MPDGGRRKAVGSVRPVAPEEVHLAVYRLPDRPYDSAALEPHYSTEALELHHSKHHAAYVKGANDALASA